MHRSLLTALLLLSFACQLAVAQSPPRVLHYQANLLESGQEVDRDIRFVARIFDTETGGQALWTEDRPSIPVMNGRISVLLGSQTAFPPSLFDGASRYLEIEIDGEQLPRLRMASTAYALRAGVAAAVAAGAVDATALAPGAAVTSVNNVPGALTIAGANGATVNVDASTKTITISAPGGTGGDTGIFGIQNNDGTLQVVDPNGPTTTLNIQPGSIGPTQLADGGIGAVQLADGAVTARKLARDAVTREALAPGAAVDALNGFTGSVDLASSDQSIGITGDAGTLDLQINPAAVVTSLESGVGLTATQATGAVNVGISEGGVGTLQLAPGAVTAAKVAPNAISSAMIVDSTISAADLAADAAVRSINDLVGDVRFEADGGATVSVDQATSTITFSAPAADGTGILSIENTDGALQITDPTGPTATINVEPGGITEGLLADSAVTSANVVDNSLTAADLAENAVGTAEVLNGALTEPKLDATNTPGVGLLLSYGGGGSFTWVDPSFSTVNSDSVTLTGDGSPGEPLRILNGGVAGDQIATGAVGADAIASGAVGSTALATGAVTDSALATDAVTADAILSQAVGTDELENGSLRAVDINASGATNGHVLSYDTTAAGDLVWQDPAAITSSQRFKTNVETIQQAPSLVERLRGVRFNWKSDGRADIGLIAEEVAEVFPELVTYEADGTTVRGLRYAPLVGVLIEAVKAQQSDLTDATATIDEQDEEIQALRDRLSRLEAAVEAMRTGQ